MEFMRALRFMLFVAFCLTLIFITTAKAQDTGQGVTAGLAFNNNGAPQFMGWGAYDKRISGRLFSYNGYDILPLKRTGYRIPQLKFTAFTGLALEVAALNKLTLWLQGAGGLATTGNVTTGAGVFGGFGHLGLGAGFGLIVGGQGSYSPISGTDAVLRLGLRYGVK